MLDQWHPGQPRLVEFVIKRPEAEDTAASVANIATLAGAGYRAPDEQVTELTGLDVTTTQQPAMGMMQSPGNPAATPLQDLHTRYAPTMLWPPAREVFDARVRRDLNALTQLSAPARQPAAHDFLSQTALQHRAAAYEKILMDAVLAGRAQGAAEVAGTTPKTGENEKSPETPLERADTPEPPNHPQNENKRFCNSFATGLRADFENASESDDAPGDDDDENGMSRREAAKHAADVRWGNAVPKGTTREGESSKYKKSGSPYARKPSAKKREQIQAVKRAIEKSQSDKTTLYDVCRIKEYPVDIPYGTPGEKEKGHYSGYGNGVSHMFANHIRPNDTTVEKAAQTIILGRKRRVGKDKIVSEFGEHVAVLGIRQGRLKLITCYRDTTGRKRKHPGQEPGSTDRNTESTAPYYADAAPLVVSDRQASVARPDVQANTTDGTINTNFQENDTTLQ